MKLILSSCDFRNERSRKVITDNLNKPISKCRLLFIPNEKATFEAIHSQLYYSRMEEFGFSKENIRIFDYYNADKFTDLNIDIIYISGGNTFATIKRIRECGFDKEIVRYVKEGAIYIGGCAGAHIASQSIDHVRAYDSVPEGMNDFSGLGLFDGILICHYTEERKPLYEKLKNDGQYNVVALTDDDSLVVNLEGIDYPTHRNALNSLKLIEPDKKYLSSYIEAYDEYSKQGITTYGLSDARSYDIFEKFDRFKNERGLNPDRVGSDFYWLVDEESEHFVGEVTIRHRLNDALRRRGGHIGYGIRYSEWNKGYGTLLLKLALKKARERGITDIMITCNDDNYGSAKVMENNGMILMDKIENSVDGKAIITRRYILKME